jgi:hypothetical protein
MRKKVLSKKGRACAKKLFGFKGNKFENTCQELFTVHFDQLLDSTWNYTTFIVKTSRMF